MKELILDNAYLRHPYHGSEIGFIFEKEREVFGTKGEVLNKGVMYIVDPDHKLQPMLEGIAPDRDSWRPWTLMGTMLCIQQDKMEDPYHIVHNFINKMCRANEDGDIIGLSSPMFIGPHAH